MFKSGYMVMQVSLANNGYIELEGPDCKYWAGEGLPTYIGPIEGLPDNIIGELLDMNLIK